jgi:uncharacterized protein YegJ (DUF2314 family)
MAPSAGWFVSAWDSQLWEARYTEGRSRRRAAVAHSPSAAISAGDHQEFDAMQPHRIAALLLLLSAVACTPLVTERGPGDDPALRRATDKAQATLDDFLAKAKQLPPGTSAHALKVQVQEGRDTETFWVEEFTWSDGSFTGKINNAPRRVKGIQLGQTYRFGRSQIVDWKYFDEKSGRTIGNFTACALLNREPPAQAEEIQRRDRLDCS